jgi:hypothetical protein
VGWAGSSIIDVSILVCHHNQNLEMSDEPARISLLSERPKMADLMILLDDIVIEWMELGRAFAQMLKRNRSWFYTLVQGIEYKYSSIELRKRAMFMLWLDYERDASWMTVIEALKRIGKQTLAIYVENAITTGSLSRGTFIVICCSYTCLIACKGIIVVIWVHMYKQSMLSVTIAYCITNINFIIYGV